MRPPKNRLPYPTLSRCIELATLFLKLGTIGFGGPAVHIATMEEEVVERRKWLSREHFLDLIGATNLIPGPNSTEMALHIGFLRAGLSGLVVAGASFILPAATVTTIFAWTYVHFGHTPQVEPWLFGIKPAMMAVIASAGWRLARTAIGSSAAALIVIAVACGSLLKFSEILLLVLGGIIGMVWLLWFRRRDSGNGSSPQKTATALLFGLATAVATRTARATSTMLAVGSSGLIPLEPSLVRLGLFFLKVGLVLYGSGYVLIAYLEGDLVKQYGWLDKNELVEAVAIGQMTPGPILSTATFIGYVVMYPQGGHSGALTGAAVATLCIFLPSFLLVAVTNPLIPRLRNRRPAAAFLDAVNAASLGLMAAVTLKLAASIFYHRQQPLGIDWLAVAIGLAAVVMVFRFKLRPVWIVLGGAVAGALFSTSGLR